jgi:ATP-dependent DNA ligase
VTTFRELAALCETLARTRSRLELARRVAEFLAALDADEVRPAVRLLLGQAGKGEIAVNGATLWHVIEPRVVVEVLFSDLQKSPTYAVGLALRFARIVRIRDDKSPAEADTVQHLRALYARQQVAS